MLRQVAPLALEFAAAASMSQCAVDGYTIE